MLSAIGASSKTHNGPTSGPTKGEAVYSIIGALSSWRANKSPTVPPATLRNALPAIPLKKRHTIMVSIFLDTAHGMSQIKNKVNEVI